MNIYETRLAQARQEMAKQGVELLVLTPSPYMQYVSGIQPHPFFNILKGPGDWLSTLWIRLEGEPVLVLHWMVYRLLSSNPDGITPITSDVRVVEHGISSTDLLRELVNGQGDGAVALADRSWAYLSERLRLNLRPDTPILFASQLMDRLLAIKDEAAVESLRRACAITDAMYGEVLQQIQPGMTERDIIVEVEYQFRRQGADGVSFPASVVFGRPGPGQPSASPKNLQPGDSIMFDVGCVVDGYCSDFGRSAFVGEPPARYVALHETVLQAQRAGMDAMQLEDATCESIVPVVQNVLTEAGYPPTIPQVGHGIGLTVHENPILLLGDDTIIQPGMTFTVEPTVRVSGWYTNRVEDIVLVTEDGVDYLTTFPRDLHIID